MKEHLKARYEHFCELLIEARIKIRAVAGSFGRKVGRSQSYISKCESRTRRMDVIEFMKVMSAIGSDPVAIIRKLK